MEFTNVALISLLVLVLFDYIEKVGDIILVINASLNS